MARNEEKNLSQLNRYYLQQEEISSYFPFPITQHQNLNC